jgi:hypothetical protein
MAEVPSKRRNGHDISPALNGPNRLSWYLNAETPAPTHMLDNARSDRTNIVQTDHIRKTHWGAGPSIKQRKGTADVPKCKQDCDYRIETGLAEIHTLGRRVRLWLGPTPTGQPSRAQRRTYCYDPNSCSHRSVLPQ